MSKHNFYVYEHWRLDRDECFYVGKGKGNRAYNMSNRNRHHKAIVAKTVREGFAVDVRIVSFGLTEARAFDLEIERISFWRALGVDLANMTTGGDGKSGAHSETHKKRISEALKGRIQSEHVIQSVILSNKKRAGTKNKKRSKTHNENLSAALKGRDAPNKKKVICVDDNIMFESATKAAIFYGLKSTSSVSEICKGNRKPFRGKVFKYFEVE